MTSCSACGAESRPGRKFCHVCGARTQPDDPSAASTASTCTSCRRELAAGARFCRYCGAPAASPAGGVPPGAVKPGDARPGMYALAAVAVLLIAAVAYGGWRYLSRAPGPDDTALASAIIPQLPAFVRLDKATLQEVQLVESEPAPTYAVRFAATGVLTRTVFLRAQEVDAIVFLGQPAAEGTSLQLSGQGFMRRAGNEWTSDVALDPHEVLTGLTPDSVPSRRTIIEGSPEEQAYLAEVQRSREEQQQAAQMAAALEAQRQETARAREEARRLELAAATERQRLEAERRSAELLAEQQRREAEELKQRLAAENDERRRREVPGPDRSPAPSQIATGQIRRNTETTVRLTQQLRSDRVNVEDRFEVVTVRDLVVDGRVVVPAGSTMRGIVSAVQPATRGNRKARMELSFDLLTIGSRSFPMRGRAPRIEGAGLKGDAGKAAVGAGVGALVGAILGGGKGAAIGAGVGGAGTVAATEGQEIDLKPGSTLTIKFEAPVDIR